MSAGESIPRTMRLCWGPDLLYRQQLVAIEYDGGNHRERLVADDRRQNALVGFGVMLLHFTAPDVFGNPDGVAMQVRDALASRMSREARPSLAATSRIVRRMSA